MEPIQCSTRKALQLLDEYGLHAILVRNLLSRRSLANVMCHLVECSSKHNRGVTEVFYEAARASMGTRPKGPGDGGCVVM
jgi:Rho family protein